MSNAVSRASVTPADAGSIIAVISKAASDPSTDVDKLERLMGLYERIMARNAETDFHAALSAAQSEMGRIAADSTNPQTHSDYASYAAIDRVLRPIYTKHGFALSFDTAESVVDQVRVLCHVSHSGGFSRTYRVDMPADGKGAKGGDVMTKTHAAGAAMQYGMRYLLKLIFNVAVGTDDDGNSAGLEPITNKQLSTIVDLIAATDTDQGKFLDWIGAASLEEIPASKFQQAVAQLKRKQKART